MNLEGGVEIEECAGDTSTYLTTTRHSLGTRHDAHAYSIE